MIDHDPFDLDNDLAHQVNRETAARWAVRVLRGRDARLLHLATTGLGRAAEIVGAALTDLDGQPMLDTLIKPIDPIPAEAAAIHGITDDMVAGAEPFADVHGALAAAVARARGPIIGYNMRFQLRILRQVEDLHGLTPLDLRPWGCAMERYAAWYGDWSGRTSQYRFKALPCRPDGAHRPWDDCRAVALLLREMAAALGPDELLGDRRDRADDGEVA